MTSRDGTLYEGEWFDDQKKGKGSLKDPKGYHYEGQFRENMRNGKGKLTFQQQPGAKVNTFYDGDWLQDKKNGQGHELLSNGDVYNGQYIDDFRHGNGRVEYYAGGSYDGQWHQGVEHGYG